MHALFDLSTRRGLLFILFILVAGLTAVAPAFGERLSIAVSKANVRSGPGTQNYEVLWEVERYHPLEVVQRSGDWILFKDFEGDQGWMHSQLVGKEPSVITKRDDCNIRSGPGIDNEIVFRAEKGVPFKVLEQKGDWIHLQSADGDKGWIHKDLVW
ncbi:MAG: SH3 domain-containing protein [Desulfobacterales bacterium]